VAFVNQTMFSQAKPVIAHVDDDRIPVEASLDQMIQQPSYAFVKAE